MTSRDFCYWLQGYIELATAGQRLTNLNPAQLDCVAKHLAMVFVHEIDPSFPDELQDVLNKIHLGKPEKSNGWDGSDMSFRC